MNITSIHVIGWVLPLCREIWFQMRWSNFEKNMNSFASFLGEFFTIFWILTGFSSFLLEPVHSSESEFNNWTNRRIVLTKYHTARALEKLIRFKNDSRRDFIGRQWLEQDGFSYFYTRSHYEDKEWASWLPVYLSILHMHSVWPHLHSTAEQNAKAFISMNIMLLHFGCPLEGYYYYYYYTSRGWTPFP